MKIGTRRPSVSIGFIQSTVETRDLKRKAVDRRGLIRWRDVSSFGKLGNNDTNMEMKKEKRSIYFVVIDRALKFNSLDNVAENERRVGSNYRADN